MLLLNVAQYITICMLLYYKQLFAIEFGWECQVKISDKLRGAFRNGFVSISIAVFQFETVFDKYKTVKHRARVAK